VAVIAAAGNTSAALAAKAATATIPIVFGVAEDPVTLGLVTSLTRPGVNATGINFFVQEMDAKRLGLLHEVVPKAVRVAVLVNPTNAPNTETTLRDTKEAAPSIGLQINLLNAATIGEIEAPLRRLRAIAPMRFSSRPTLSSPATAFNWPTWRSMRGFQRFIPTVITSQLAD
jgi:putative ABC transport system substrate-binding protein